MRRIFTRDSLKRSIRPILIILIACVFFYFWGNYRKVSVDMTLRPEIPNDVPIRLEMTVYDADGDVAASFAAIQHEGLLTHQHLDLRPGNYQLRGIAATRSGKNVILQKEIVVPDDDASMEIFLRP